MPTFTVHTSSSLTNLSSALATVLMKEPAPPLVRETVVVLSNGMARWLSIELAAAQGVCAGLDFRFPNDTLDLFFRAALPGLPSKSPFALETMTWRIAALLPVYLDRPGFENISVYLGDRSDDRRLLQLSRTLADTFDQYTIFRPQTILQWDKGDGGDWQAVLWRALTDGCADLHRAAQLQKFSRLLASGELPPGLFPPRISLFGISFLPSFHLEFFSILSRYVKVDLYLLNPCGSYWGDLLSEKRKATLALNMEISAESLEYYDTGNPLLSSLGTQGQEFFNMLLDLNTSWNDLDGESSTVASSLLGIIQTDILDLRYRGDAVPRAEVKSCDRSLQIHSCHGPLREMEVLYDNLLRMFEDDPGLEPRDIVVMTPDIATYAPYITATFGTRCGGRPAIPFTIADQAARRDNPVINAFMHILELPNSRFGLNSVLEILECPQVMARFNITCDEREQIREWLCDAGVRWGMNGEHRASLGFPAYSDFSWQAGLDRLFLGYAMVPDNGLLFGDIMPCDNMEGQQALTLGKLATLVDTVANLSGQLSLKQTLGGWSTSLADVAASFLSPLNGNDTSCASLYTAFQSLKDSQDNAGFHIPIGLEAIRDCLSGLLDTSGGGFGFLGGRVTFCAMLPMRSIPLRVVCLVGMNDGIFPRNPRPPTFSLMAGTRRRGDRSIRDEDRYLFLEALMSAGERFYISYTGQNDRDNSSRPPSVVVEELIDYARRAFILEGTSEIVPDIVTRHRLHSFSPEYFTHSDNPNLFSYSTENRDALESRRTNGESQRVFMDSSFAEDAHHLQEVEMQQLIRFLHNPARTFLASRMSVTPYKPAEEIDEQEPFTLDGLNRYSLKQELTAALLDNKESSRLYAQARSRGLLPPLTVGRIAFDAAFAECDSFAQLISPLLGDLLDDLLIDLDVRGTMLQGVMKEINQGRLLRWRCASMKGKDILGVWCEHLILNCIKNEGYPRESQLVCTDLTLSLPPLRNADELLADLVGLYREGLCRPLPFFPQASWLYCTQGLAKAEERWNGSDYSLSPAESSEPSFALCFRGQSVLGDEFAKLAQQVFGPLLAVATPVKTS